MPVSRQRRMQEESEAQARAGAECLHFGMHRGVPLADVPLHYLEWVLREVRSRTCLRGQLRVAVNDEVRRRGGTPPPPPEDAVNDPWTRACGDCGATNFRYEWGVRSDGKRFIRARCCECGRPGGNTPLREPFIALADADAVLDGEPSDPQGGAAAPPPGGG